MRAGRGCLRQAALALVVLGQGAALSATLTRRDFPLLSSKARSARYLFLPLAKMLLTLLHFSLRALPECRSQLSTNPGLPAE